MNKSNLLVISFCLFTLSFEAGAEPPIGWHVSGSKPESFETGLDSSVSRDGFQCAYLRSSETGVEGFGTVMQKISSDAYRGSRIRLRGWMKSEEVKEWAAFWIRTDGSETGQTLTLDNMQNRPITGTNDWQQHELVIDVDFDAHLIAFGFLLFGEGAVWVDDLSLEVVPKTTPVTANYQMELLPKSPVNLSFNE